jgi:L-fuconolactonase
MHGSSTKGTASAPFAGQKHDAPAQMSIRPDWLSSQNEEILDPELPIIDSHHHIWDPPSARYLFDEYLQDTRSGHNIVASVFVECHGMWRARGPEALRPVGETEFIAGVAAQSDTGRYGNAQLCAAIIGLADLSLGEYIQPVLAAHIAAAGGRLRGIRGRTSAHEDPDINKWGTPAGVLRDPAARSAIAAIARQGLSLDVWVYQTQLDDVADLCKAFPDLCVIINHTGGPLGCGPYTGKRDQMFPAWAEGVRAVARMPNACMKLGGLGMRFSGFEFHRQAVAPSSDALAKAWHPYIETCIEAFGADRCLFESNFPADKGTCSYHVLWNTFKKLGRGLSVAERSALFHGTAQRVYRITAP